MPTQHDLLIEKIRRAEWELAGLYDQLDSIRGVESFIRKKIVELEFLIGECKKEIDE